MYQKIDEAQFYPTLAETTGIALVFFTRQGCGSCRAWKQLLKQFSLQRHDIHIFELDAEKSMGLINEYEIFHMPALYLFMNGEFHCELQAEASLDALSSGIHDALEQPAHEAP